MAFSQAHFFLKKRKYNYDYDYETFTLFCSQPYVNPISFTILLHRTYLRIHLHSYSYIIACSYA